METSNRDCVSYKRTKIVNESVHLAPAIETVYFSFLPFSLSVFGHHAPYHISIKVRSEEGPKLCKGQFTSCSYCLLSSFCKTILQVIYMYNKLWAEIRGEKLLWARTEDDTEMKKTQ